MSVVLEKPDRMQSPVQPIPVELPDARVLEDKTPIWMRSTPASAVVTLLIGIVFLLLASRSLWPTDLWDHLNYGQNILRTRTVSDTEPLLRLSRGVSMVNIPWLAQVGMASLNNRFGLTSLQFLFATLIAGSLGVVAWRGVRSSHSVIGGIVAATIFFVVNLDQLMIIRPQLAGVFLYCIVVAWSLGHHRHSRAVWIGLPLMFAVWANIHGSFVMGLMLMTITAAGRFGDILRSSKSLRIALLDRGLHRTVLLTQLCAASALLNPAGLSIYPEILNVAGNPNMESMFEWDALTLRSTQGQFAAAAALLASFVIRFSPRRMRCGAILAFVITGLLSMWSARMLNWWAPLAGILVGTHLMAALRTTVRWLKDFQLGEAKGLWTVINVLLIAVIFFPLSNFGALVLKGRVQSVDKLVSRGTPLATVAFLESMESSPRGIAFVPAEWAGYVMNRGPRTLEPMVNLHVHVIPEKVWNDYLRLNAGPSDWDGLMDDYGINLAVIDKNRQPALLKRIRESTDWTQKYDDRQGTVFVRNKPI